MRDKIEVETRDPDGSLLPTLATKPQIQVPYSAGVPSRPRYTFGVLHIFLAFILGIFVSQTTICRTNCLTKTCKLQTPEQDAISMFAPPIVGSTSVHHFPPPSPTNAYPSLFPSNVGFGGGTATGGEPAVVATAPAHAAVHTGQCSNLRGPKFLDGKVKGQITPTKESVDVRKKRKFNLFRSWGNLTPWFSIERGGFGVNSSPTPPKNCKVTGLHLLHRHGARYPTAYDGPARLATKLHDSTQFWNVSGELDFLNDWTYKLGEEILTAFGRQQLYDLGISTRIKYGFLLENFTEQNTIPVFRTNSQDRMVNSALNFALGFFGYPLEGKYQQSIIIGATGFNNTLAPWNTCPNAFNNSVTARAAWYSEQWRAKYLEDARHRLQKYFTGDFDLTLHDVQAMQELCAYETVALGYSKFCELFTEEEWEGFNYLYDLQFWYGFGFGSPVSRALGIGYVQELVARLTHTPIKTYNSSTNSTLDGNPITFPLDQSLYVDATHDGLVLSVIAALNLNTFAESGPLSYTHIRHDRSFRVSELAPFATNIQFQLLECTSLPDPQIRVIINDGVVPLTGIRGCGKHNHGMCPVDKFVAAQKETIQTTDWEYDCHGDWAASLEPEWQTVTGDPPKRK